MLEEKGSSDQALEAKVISEVKQCIEKLKKEMGKQGVYYKVEEKKDNLPSTSKSVGEGVAPGLVNRDKR